jgi:hypothetical protein
MISMNAVRNAIRCAFVFLAAMTSGCGGGYNYQPVDENGQPIAEWSHDLEDVRFSTGQFSAVIGEKNTIAFIDIDNKSEMRVTVLGGELQTNERSIAAHVLEDGESVKARSVPARSGYKRIMLYWQFDSPASELLGPSINWTWRVRIGPTEHVLRIPMRRRVE